MSLVGWWKLDGNGLDSAPNKRDGSPHPNIVWVDGKISQAGQFNGINTTIGFGLGSDFFPLPSFSMAAWFKSAGTTATTGTSPCLWGFTYGIRLQVNASSLTFGLDNGSSFTYVSSPANYDFYNDNKWHHVVATATPTERKLYIDGEHVGTLADSWLGTTRWPTNVCNLGRDNNNVHYYFTGEIDDFRLYDHALSPKEAKELALGKVLHMKMDDLTDSTGYGWNVTPENAVINEVNPVLGTGSFENDARAARRIIVPDAPHVMGDQTISMWLYPTANTVRRNPWNRAYGGEGTMTHEPAGTINYYWGTHGGDSSPYQMINTGQALPLNEWSHVVLVRDLSGANQLRWYVNGVLTATTTAAYAASAKSTASLIIGQGYTGYYEGRIEDVREYVTPLSVEDIQELYQQRASLDSEGSLFTHHINETKHSPMFVDYTTWQVGTGSAPFFATNGSDAENHRILGPDPWGKETVIWEAQPDAVSGADGAWNGSYYGIDPAKTYRFSVWLRRTVVGNGSYYLGTNGGTVTVQNASGTANGNPYFSSGAWPVPAGDWMLVVGHVHGHAEPRVTHPDTGRYLADGTKFSGATDFWNDPGTTSLRHRAYLYYSTDTTTRQQFVYPRMDLVDGTEPSIQELIQGHDSRNIDYVRDIGGTTAQALSVGSASTKVATLNEVGPTNGLAIWLPPATVADSDISGNENNATTLSGVTTSVGEGRGMSFHLDAKSDYILIPTQSSSEISMSMWYFYEISATWNTLACRDGGGQHHILIATGSNEIGFYNSGWSSSGFALTPNSWHHIVRVKSGTNSKLYVDGNLKQDAVSFDNSTYPLGILGNYSSGTPNQGALGRMQDIRVYNRVLTPEEVGVLYDLTSPSGTMMKQTSNSLYVRGQFNEVSL